ncbi:hypothetical protein GF357_04960 [Candidatus Dojkabacteria bacterium]|nr:hypothetical protein [Candidatus Dojkabacteria bacterium]
MNSHVYLLVKFILIAAIPIIATLLTHFYFFRNIKRLTGIFAGYLVILAVFIGAYLLASQKFNIDFSGLQEIAVIFTSIIYTITTTIQDSGKKGRLSSKLIKFYSLIAVISISTAIFLPKEIITLTVISVLSSLIGTAVQFMMLNIANET